ncbi:myelin transcription factor 1-like [Saccostrea cucullata]|uniref:myelin transcription factor 1-like n=1 Tax=Saccostrea cuccullata TaxID=36930 RepID=UPI002ED4D19E
MVLALEEMSKSHTGLVKTLETRFLKGLESLQSTVSTLSLAVENLNSQYSKMSTTPNKSKSPENEINSIKNKLKKSDEIKNELQVKIANQQLELETKEAQLKNEKIMHNTCKQQLLDLLEANKSESSTLVEKLKTKNEELLNMENENKILKEKNEALFKEILGLKMHWMKSLVSAKLKLCGNLAETWR